MSDMAAFFTVHQDLPREGPGEAADVAWALGLAGVPKDGALCDMGCGPGDDVAALRAHVPEGHVLAMDLHEPFAQAAAARFSDDPGVSARAGDMAALAEQPEAPFDLIWCAGALYFLGIDKGLSCFRKALAAGGHVAFSEPAYFVDAPSKDAQDFWQGHPTQSEAVIRQQVADAGYEVIGARRLSDAAWEAYYQPMEARIAKLRPGADAALAAALDENGAEAALWRQVRRETGYLLMVVRPV